MFVFIELLKLGVKLPGLTPDEITRTNEVINDLTNIWNAYQLGQLSGDTAREQVTDVLEFFYGQVGDFLGAYVAGTIVASTAAASTSSTGPGALWIGVSGVGVGAAISQMFPDTALAEITAGLIFGSAESIDAMERALGEQVQDRMFDWLTEMRDWIYRDMPAGFPRPLAENGTVNGVMDGSTHVFSGTVGRDTVRFSTATSAVIVDLAAEGVQATGGAGPVKLLTIDGLVGSNFNDVLFGNDLGNTLAGGLGDDVLDGRGGFDFLDYRGATGTVTIDLRLTVQNTGSAGVDTVHGFEGIIGTDFGDALTGDGGSNTVYAGGGSDTVYGLGGDDLIVARTQAEGTLYNTIDGGSGFDVVSYDGLSDAMVVYLDYGSGSGSASFQQSSTLTGIDSLFGIEGVWMGSGSDRVVGSDLANEILGNGGNDILYGMGGDDFIEGGAGNDEMYGDGGFDTLSYALAGAGVSVNLAVMGAPPPPWYPFPTAWDTGGAGIDTAQGFEGVLGSQFDDTIVGDAGANHLHGAGGNDVLNGGDGADILVGGQGVDELYGGGGADTFLFDYAADSDSRVGGDVIMDFQDGLDLLDLSGLGLGGSQNAAIIVQGGSTWLKLDLDADGVDDFAVEIRGVTSGFDVDDIIWS